MSFSKIRDLINQESGNLIADYVLIPAHGNNFVFPFNPIYNYSNRKYQNCLVILFFYFVSGDKKYPVSFDYWISEIYYDSDETYLDKNDLFIKNIDYLISQGLNFEHVIFDAGFCNEKIIRYLSAKNIKFVTRCKSNKKINNKFKLNQLFKEERNGSFYYYHRYKSFLKAETIDLFESKIKLVAVANNKLKLIEKDLCFLVSNNLDLKFTTILVLYKLRWSIESFFKILKSYLSLSVFYRNNYQYVNQRIHLSLIAFYIVQQKANQLNTTFYQALKHIQNHNIDTQHVQIFCDYYVSDLK